MGIRAMASAISGLRINQNKLDVVGNNIANQSTTGFKGQFVNYVDTISQSVKQATGATRANGGTDPQQIGLGADTGSITTDTSQGSLNPTNRNLDNAIDGSGYFMVATGETMFSEDQCIKIDPQKHNILSTPTGTDISYTRDGSFALDNQGNLLSADGHRILGYSMIGRSQIYKDDTNPANNKYGTTTSLSRDQDQGTLDMNASDASTYTTAASTLDGMVNKALTTGAATPGSSTYISSGDVAFVDSNDADLKADNTHLHSLKIPDVVKKIEGDKQADGTIKYTAKDVKVKGFSIEKNGVIKADLADGSSAAVGQIALASFTNPGGLSKVGGNLLEPSANSGSPLIESGYAAKIKALGDNSAYNTSVTTEDNSSGYGDVRQGCLESSNVDLALQFTDMIVASRAYQANGKMITTSDEILQDLVNLKR